MVESVQSRMQESVAIPQSDITVPSNLKSKIGRKTKFGNIRIFDKPFLHPGNTTIRIFFFIEVEEEEPQGETTMEGGGGGGEEEQKGFSFVLMTKGKGNKPALKTLKVEKSIP